MRIEKKRIIARRALLATAVAAAGALAVGLPAAAHASTPAVSITGGADIAYQDFNGALETVTPDGVNHDSGLGMAGGTNPSIAAGPNGTYEAVMQANTGVLWEYSNSGVGHPQKARVWFGTSPSIGFSGLHNSYQTYFQSGPGRLGHLSGFGGKDLLRKSTIAIDQQTSPSSYQGAVALVTNGEATSFSVGAGSAPGFPVLPPTATAPGSSPSLSFFPESHSANDHEAVAWEDPEDLLRYTIITGVGATAVAHETDTNLHMMPGTSPAIAVRSDGRYEVAFEGNDSKLWIVDSQGQAHDTQYEMDGDTSPSVTVVNALGFEVAFQANTHALWTVNGESFLGQAVPGAEMHGGTSPSINAYHPTF